MKLSHIRQKQWLEKWFNEYYGRQIDLSFCDVILRLDLQLIFNNIL